MKTQELVDHLARTPLSQILLFALVLSIYRVLTYKYVKNMPLQHRTGAWRFISGISELCDALIYAAIFIFMVIRPFFFQTFQIPTGSMVPTNMVGDFIGLNKLVYRYTDPKRGDIVVFRPPVEAVESKDIEPDGKTVKVDFVKRLIGLPGDKIELHNGHVYVNDKPLWEPYKQYTFSSDNVNFRLLTGAEADGDLNQRVNWKLVKYKGEIIPLSYTEFDANMVGHGYFVAPKYVLSDEREWPIVKALPAEKIPDGYYLFMGDNRNGSFDGRAWGLVPRSSIIGRAEFVWLPFPRLGKIHYVDNGERPAPGSEIAEFLK